MTTYSVHGKVALVTGAARGIGLATAQHLHQRGAYVVLVDLDPEASALAAKELGDRAIGVGADVTDAAAMEEVVARAVRSFGGLDLVVANAGIAPPQVTARVMDPRTFERVLEVNVLGVYRTVHAALPEVVRNQGHVVVVSSIYAFVNGVLAAPYAMSKAAVEQYGRALRGELAQHGVGVSVAYFGFIETAMTKEAFTGPIGKRFEDTFPKVLMKKLQPVEAGAAIVDGVERRAARIIAPKRWTAFSVLRGLVNPGLDRRNVTNSTIQGILRDADVEHPR